VVGITTVFSADGNYIMSNMSREADYERYPEELLRALRGCIDDVKKRNAWQSEDAIRLIFHVFKPLKETEADAVKRLVSGLLSEFRSVEFAFVHVSDEHDWVAQQLETAFLAAAEQADAGTYAQLQAAHDLTVAQATSCRNAWDLPIPGSPASHTTRPAAASWKHASRRDISRARPKYPRTAASRDCDCGCGCHASPGDCRKIAR
jgi:hypothetical protein